MAQFHFVEDYERVVSDLIERYPIDEAMSLAVGGLYDELGPIEVDVLRYAGLKDGMTLIDFGCGSGRLASVLDRSLNVDYTGIDVVQALLDYAKSRSPDHYRFLLNRTLSIPAPENSCDYLCAFSVFTHLLHAESYIYLDDIKRVLKPDGTLVFSFLEFAVGGHWNVFESTVEAQSHTSSPPLNMFIERSVIDLWCKRLGYVREGYISATETRWNGKPLGQSIAILKKPRSLFVSELVSRSAPSAAETSPRVVDRRNAPVGNHPEQTNFTAHNIRLDDGEQTLRSLGSTMDQNPIFRSVCRMLKLIFPEGLENKSIVDLGCLEGGYSVEFARLGMEVTGIEARQSNYDNCLYVKDRVNLPNLKFIRDDVKNTANYGGFDVFFISGLLYHLDKPRRFLEQIACNCYRAMFIHTHVAPAGESESIKIHRLSEISENEGLPGRWYQEHVDVTTDDLEQLKWASWSNTRSFWIQKEYLLRLIKNVGFDAVLEQFDWMDDIAAGMTAGDYRKRDRVMLVGIKPKPA